MRRPLPLWLAAVVPAMIAGHAIAYAISGRTTSDGHHAWIAPLLEGSLAVTLAVVTWLIGGVLAHARSRVERATERHVLALWPRLALVQLALFCALERVEGAPVTWIGCAVQIVVALLAAYALSRFADVLAACSRGAAEAARYLERLAMPPSVFRAREPRAAAFAHVLPSLNARFGRAPPRSTFR